MNVVEEIRKTASSHGAGVAVVEGSERLTYRDLVARVDAVSAELRSMGIVSSRPVGLLCDDSVEYIILSLALLSVGSAIVPIPSDVGGEIDRILDAIDPEFVVYQSGVAPFDDGVWLKSIAPRQSNVRVRARGTRKPRPPGYDDVGAAFIRFSSGTTSASKGVVLSHRAILERLDAANAGLEITEQDRVLWVLSMSFHFVVTILLFLRQGATIILCGRDFPSAMATELATHEPTVLYASPFHFRVMTSSDMFAPDSVRRVRLAVSTAASLPLPDARQFQRKFGVALSEAYGIIEVGLPFLNDSRDPEKKGSVGRALPGYEMRLANADASGLGEILIRGPGMLDAYYEPWRPKDEILEKGWFATGDLGSMDDDGFLYLRGRRKNVINFAGMKVFPEEVEATLSRCPGVRESRVYAHPHDEFGELPYADVVLGAEDATTAREIRRFCYRHLPSYQVPKQIRFVTELPKTPSGKIRRWEPGVTS